VTVLGDARLRLGELEARLIHVPAAHTDGDLLVHVPAANVLHMGDCFFNGLYPIIDTGTGGTVDGLIAALDRGLALSDTRTRIVAGHGPVGGRADLKKARDMLVEVRDRVARLKRAGKTREQTLAAAPTRDLDATWGQDWVKPAQIVGSVYDSLPARP
jgi:glyoxylase-like metal-dependent hydrolase (beta-lactamase superfamily II)